LVYDKIEQIRIVDALMSVVKISAVNGMTDLNQIRNTLLAGLGREISQSNAKKMEEEIEEIKGKLEKEEGRKKAIRRNAIR
jgi:hypothetical protein